MELVKKQSLSKNFFYQIAYQVIIIVIPLIISPYLTRKIGDTGLGIYSYVYSIAGYFVLLAMLGISKYGQRCITFARNDHDLLRRKFWSLFFVHKIASIIALILYFGFSFLFVKENFTIFLVESIYVLSALFDTTWLFYGLENFRPIVLRNLIVKVFETIAIFVFIKDSGDLYIYALIVSIGFLTSHLIVLPRVFRIVKPIKFNLNDCKEHIKPLFVFAVAVVAISLYTFFDKTLLGLLSTKENVAYYTYSEKIIQIPKSIIGVIGIVMFPRACKMANEGNFEQQKKYMVISIILTCILGFGAIFGLAAISNELAIIYYGSDFAACGKIILFLAPIIIINGIGDVLRSQYMIPMHMDKQYTICIILNAIINLILSTILIPFIGVYGAVVGTLAAELFGMIYQMILCRKVISPLIYIKKSIPYVVIGLIMFFVLYVLNSYLSMNWKNLLILILVGLVIYLLLTFVCLLLFEKELFNSIMKRLKIKKS